MTDEERNIVCAITDATLNRSIVWLNHSAFLVREGDTTILTLNLSSYVHNTQHGLMDAKQSFVLEICMNGLSTKGVKVYGSTKISETYLLDMDIGENLSEKLTKLERDKAPLFFLYNLAEQPNPIGYVDISVGTIINNISSFLR